MSLVTYTAKREIEKLAYLKSGTDISAAAADDSFNATSTNLSGLIDNEWINTSGFANSANNGWFQANGNSTTTKISQDTTASLVTESAGPSITIQGYKRGYGQSYNLESGMQQLTRDARTIRKEQESLGGSVETLLQRRIVAWNVKTDILEESALAQWREFHASVESGETFTFDPYGSAASPDKPVSCIMDSDSYTESRLGASKLYEISFRVRVL